MIELKNVSKTYVTKKGVSVLALNGISLKLPDKGMIFILGKSGSGKSTLLNLMGGLDKFDSGEMIIKGKSTKDFSQSELDSYRNTSIGFIFQDYNILEEFTVGANIALAMQLQGLKASNEALNKILEEVDLVGYAQRKPNELSGGQMQRVAIARALIKNPEIIMADEPTGALDSRTGLQVFDTLQKLSKDKLVLIVSHDREYAELYGDRVIEIADGKVISDIQKRSSENVFQSQGVNIIDESVIQIKQGYSLSNEDLELIRQYVEKSEADTFISMESDLNKKFKRVANINDTGKRESFHRTIEEDIPSSNEDLKLIKSKLPAKSAVKIGASALKYKKFRLVMTIIMTVISLGLFGLADAIAAFNAYTTSVNSIVDSGIINATFGKRIDISDQYNDDYTYVTNALLDDADIAYLKTETGLDVKPVYCGDSTYNYGYQITDSLYDSSKLYSSNGMAYYSGNIYGAVEFSKEEITAAGLELVGRMPSSANEVVISRYMYEHFELAGYSSPDGGHTVKPAHITSPNVFLSLNPSPKLYLFGQTLTIVGVVDTKIDEDKYRPVFESNDINMMDYMTIMEFQNSVLQKGLHSLLFVYDGVVDYLVKNGSSVGSSVSGEIMYGGYYYNGNVQLVGEQEVLFPEGKTSLGANEGLVSMSYVDTYLLPTNLYDEVYEAYIDSLEDLMDFSDADLQLLYEEAKLDCIMTDILPELVRSGEIIVNAQIGGIYYHDTIKIAGIYSDEYYSSAILVSQAFFDGMPKNPNAGGKYLYGMAFMPQDTAGVKKVMDLHKFSSEEAGYTVNNEVVDIISSLVDLLDVLAKVFLYLGLALIVMASLMLMNFIATSITHKKKEIGILRAVGARSKDVFNIFFSESLIISLINFAISVVLAGFVASFLNNMFRADYGLLITVLNFGIRQIAIILGVSVASAFIASFLPVYKTARKKPIDAIRKR